MIARRKSDIFLSKKERGQISDYLLNIRDWKICHMVSRYIEALAQFREHYKKANPLSEFPFRELEKICNILYNLKEEHHLVFKRVIGPEKIRQEDQHKIMPDESEAKFIGNVGMLFHKILVARELKYIHLHYDPLSDVGSSAKDELIHYLHQLNDLFQAGSQVMLEFIEAHSRNVLLLSYLYTNSKMIKASIGLSGIDILKRITGQNNLEPIYFVISRYYFESGWYDRSQKLLKQVIRKNPKHREARALLEEVKVKKMALESKRSSNDNGAGN
ncbi:MAG: hypothetical protein Q9P14_15510 [candidate division KSB1 bacterium]|nr:hypothetical protein [candidate division KSB1 bacterium]MDQ7063731.1 hypothetical protein [candidate division KSB1 bacterium]